MSGSERASPRCFKDSCLCAREAAKVLKKGKIRFGERRKIMFHLFNKCLLSTFYVPGTVLGGWELSLIFKTLYVEKTLFLVCVTSKAELEQVSRSQVGSKISNKWSLPDK